MTKAHDERGKRLVTDDDLDRIEAIATPMYQSTRDAAGASKYRPTRRYSPRPSRRRSVKLRGFPNNGVAEDLRTEHAPQGRVARGVYARVPVQAGGAGRTGRREPWLSQPFLTMLQWSSRPNTISTGSATPGIVNGVEP